MIPQVLFSVDRILYPFFAVFGENLPPPSLKSAHFNGYVPAWMQFLALWEGKKGQKSASTKFTSGAVKIVNRIENSKKC